MPIHVIQRIAILLFSALVWHATTHAQNAGESESTGEQVDAQRLMDELPLCSCLREELVRNSPHQMAEQPYMERMRGQGVARASVEIAAILEKGKPTQLRIDRRLYFSRLDGADSQIVDIAALKRIEESGLSLLLDEISRARALKAPVVRGPDLHFFTDKQLTADLEFFAVPTIRERQVMFGPRGHLKPLEARVILGDLIGTRTLLESRKFADDELDQALFASVLSRYDNTTVMHVLLTAGANVNARASNGVIPLMSAIAHPCNLIPLLNAGADLNARDKWGRTAIQQAREQRMNLAVRILEGMAETTHSTPVD